MVEHVFDTKGAVKHKPYPPSHSQPASGSSASDTDTDDALRDVQSRTSRTRSQQGSRASQRGLNSRGTTISVRSTSRRTHRSSGSESGSGSDSVSENGGKTKEEQVHEEQSGMFESSVQDAPELTLQENEALREREAKLKAAHDAMEQSVEEDSGLG